MVTAVAAAEATDADRPAATGARAVVTVPIAALSLTRSLRSAGQDPEHVRLLAEIDAPLPPILVERRSMRVIDGEHRLMAALLRGAQTIEVEYFEGTSEEAFLRAVEANVSHGLPLSQADRRAAAERIVGTHPFMSDRAIARVAGLGARTVAAIRRRSTDPQTQFDGRLGRDGKVRPLSSVAGRQRAAELIAERPEASLREVARLAGISPATVSDVRRRLESGQSPLPDGPATSRENHDPQDTQGAAATVHPVRLGAGRRVQLVREDPTALLDKLVRDPSLRHKEEGRQLLRLLQQNAIGMRGWNELTAVVPAHCRELVMSLARQYAETWQGFARELDEKARVIGQVPAPRRPVGAPLGSRCAEG